MSKIVSAVVVSFGPGTRGRYGYLKVKGRKAHLYFSFGEGRGFVERDGKVVWSQSRVMRDPRTGDRIRLEIGGGRSRPYAKPWGFETEAEAIEERIKSRVLA